MHKIYVDIAETEFDQTGYTYIYQGKHYVSVNGEQPDGLIDLIPKEEWDSMMKEGLDLINSTQALIDSLKKEKE